MKYYTPILTIIFIFSIYSFPVKAEEQEYFGLSMHGDTKYSSDAPYLDYVNPNAPKGGHIKIAAIGTFDTLNPYSIKGQAPENMNLVYDRLMRRTWDEPFTMYPLIAERVSISDDRSAVTFYINPKARFHDGSPITAEDVLYSYQTLMDFGRPNMRRIYKLVDRAEIKNSHEIYFHFGAGYDRETVMILAMMPILSKTWWSEKKFDSTITQRPLLNGPYKIKSFEVGRNIVYERVLDYWAADLFANKGHYNFDSITYEYFRDDTIALESFKKGEQDIRREWDIGKWQSAYSDAGDGIILDKISHARPERAHGFIFNMRRPPFDDDNVRKALSLAFDDHWVEKNLYHGAFKRINSVYVNSALAAPDILSPETLALVEGYKDTLPPEVFLPITHKDESFRKKLQQASTLLNDSGWIIENGVRVQKNSKVPLSFEIILSSLQEEKIALTYQRALERLGVKMNIRMLDSATFQDRKQNYDYDMIVFYWQNTLSPGTEQVLYWSCQSAKQAASFNLSGICNPALDAMSGAIANAQTYEELKSYTNIIDRILMQKNIMIPLFYNGVDYIAYQRNITRPQTTSIYGAVLETWWNTEQIQ